MAAGRKTVLVIDPPDGRIPFQPWALAKRNHIRDHWLERPEFVDSRVRCLPAGPRFTFSSSYNGWQVLQPPHQVVIYQGRPGGLLFWDPKQVRVTRVDQGDLTPFGLRAVRAQRADFNNLKDAADFVKRESPKARAKRANSTTSTSSSTTISSTTSTSAP